MIWGDMPAHWYEAYDRGRPGYPEAVVDAALIPPPATVLEQAAGTGRLTRLLRDRFAHVIAAEPDPGMRRFLVQHLPATRIVSASVDDIPLHTASVDAMFVAQAFHQFDARRAIAEIARVLRPAGPIVMLWNVQAGEAQPSLAPVEELLAPEWPAGWDPLDLGVGFGRNAWRAAASGRPFGDLREERLPNPQTVDRDGLVAFFGSMGWIARKADDERVRLLDQVRALLTAEQYVPDQPVLAALGLCPRERAGAIAAQGAAVAVVAAVVAALLAFLGSTLTPVSLGRQAEPRPGLRLDPLVHLGGGAAVAVVVLVGAVAVGWRLAGSGAAQAHAGHPAGGTPPSGSERDDWDPDGARARLGADDGSSAHGICGRLGRSRGRVRFPDVRLQSRPTGDDAGMLRHSVGPAARYRYG